MYKKLRCERHRYIFYGILKLEVTFNIISIMLLCMREYKQPDFKEMLLLNQHHFISLICANERTSLQLNFKSYMEDYLNVRAISMIYPTKS